VMATFSCEGNSCFEEYKVEDGVAETAAVLGGGTFQSFPYTRVRVWVVDFWGGAKARSNIDACVQEVFPHLLCISYLHCSFYF
jgi:hypothetical protein